MTRAEKRAMLSLMRSEEYKRRKRMDLTIFWLAFFLGVVVPLLWYGAIEYGMIPPIKTEEFKHAVEISSLIISFVFILYASRAFSYFRHQDLVVQERDLDTEDEAGKRTSPA